MRKTLCPVCNTEQEVVDTKSSLHVFEEILQCGTSLIRAIMLEDENPTIYKKCSEKQG